MHVLLTSVAWLAIVLGILGAIYVVIFNALAQTSLPNAPWWPMFVPLSVTMLAIIFLIFRHHWGL